jgi:glucosyl-3-phosphoglycerate synthase
VDPLSVVVIPAQDEEDRITGCLLALARQTVGTSAFSVILVADACTDATAAVARESAADLGLALTVLDGPGQGTGPARRLGMEAAAVRLEQLGLGDGLIASTDADSEPAEDWLERQLAAIGAGARVIAGLIELHPHERVSLPAAVLARRRDDAGRRMAEVLAADPTAAHHHFAGASLGITAATYRAVGGLDPTASLEDEVFGHKLAAHGIPVLRSSDVVVRTAARTDGRARRGLSVDLAVASWREQRRYRAADFRDLRTGPRAVTVTVIIPTRDCAETIAGVLSETVAPVRDAGLLDRVIVVDAASADGTAEIARAAGAEVIQQDQVLAEFGPALGKGDAMWRGLAASDGDIVCFLDGDTADPVSDHLLGLVGPMLSDPELQLIKGAFARPLRSGDELLANEGGRVTELMARPLLNLHFPLLAGFAQPLAGEFAVRRALLEALAIPVGYGVEIAVLIDALRRCGLGALGESELGTRQNRHQSLRSLGEMAFAVLAAVESRIHGARSTTAGQFLRPWGEGEIVRVPIAERPALADLQCAWSELASASPASWAS